MSDIELLIEEKVKEYKISSAEELEEREYYRRILVEKWKKGKLVVSV